MFQADLKTNTKVCSLFPHHLFKEGSQLQEKNSRKATLTAAFGIQFFQQNEDKKKPLKLYTYTLFQKALQSGKFPCGMSTTQVLLICMLHDGFHSWRIQQESSIPIGRSQAPF